MPTARQTSCQQEAPHPLQGQWGHRGMAPSSHSGVEATGLVAKSLGIGVRLTLTRGGSATSPPVPSGKFLGPSKPPFSDLVGQRPPPGGHSWGQVCVVSE